MLVRPAATPARPGWRVGNEPARQSGASAIRLQAGDARDASPATPPGLGSGSSAQAGELSHDRWTVVATSYTDIGATRLWRFAYGHDERATYDAAFSERIILMHRRRDNGWELVARLPPPSWRHLVRWRQRRPLILPPNKFA